MISSCRLKFGRAPGISAEPIPGGPITVFVGPNNSGKSKVLSEINEYCRSGQRNALSVILEELEFSGLDVAAAATAVEHLRVKPNPGESLNVGYIVIGGWGGRQQVPADQLTQIIQNPAQSISTFCNWFLSRSTLMLDGRSRIDLVNQQAAGDLQQGPQSSFQVLFRDDAKRHEVRRIVAEAFGTYFVLDPTQLGQLRIRLASRPPSDDREERGIHDEAVRFHSTAQLIELASDGVKAFTGIITELIAGNPRVVLIDEPEAFLHPSLSSKLGLEISRASLESNKRVYVSTHSPQFVMGCIQSGASVNIVRLTYRDGVATARVLPSGEILELMRNPLLRSTGVLSGLFYEFVVVTESDADRAFYQEINDRLLRFLPDSGIPNCLFINAQNKQTVHTIMRPLRKLGIPTAAIVDIDVVKEGGTNWSNLIQSANVPQVQRNSIAALRASIKSAMDATRRDIKRDGGVSVLPVAEQDGARNLLNQLAQYGVFVVRGGELESWLKSLGAAGHGPSWLVAVFEKMGEDPSHADYLRPSGDDVWAFMSDVKGWLVNPARDGIPK
jgi:ABC-type cobalamin/Fe3+-siderophores transport system ATPase subunit